MFKKLDFIEPSTYQTNFTRVFVSKPILRAHLETSFNFAFGMSFGNSGHHRNHRTGGNAKRKNGEIFINAFQGKIAEFAFYEWLKGCGVSVALPDVSIMGKGLWDDSDFIVEGKKISVKSAAHFSNLMLLETKDWSDDANYIPNMETGNASYDYFVFIRIKPDGKTLMKLNKLLFVDYFERSELKNILRPEEWSFDVTGFAKKADIQIVIADKHILPQGALLNGKTAMDASNYYLQSGDLRKMEELVELLG